MALFYLRNKMDGLRAVLYVEVRSLSLDRQGSLVCLRPRLVVGAAAAWIEGATATMTRFPVGGHAYQTNLL